MIPKVEHIVAAGVKQATAEKWADAVANACAEFSISTPQRIAGFLSQCAHESGGFERLQENLNSATQALITCRDISLALAFGCALIGGALAYRALKPAANG